ncbi:MAG: PEP-CTERM sorting domain-containing protein [Phycisphaerae bacterium]|nr:PEP-CTERM sorting domain-containing protein [Phycisphaerae bacterium]NIT57267.1 PEP-CTERM sorting domain-containing protein [Fodinibius sp.]NIS51512.1 PEP-CTERM sorting domain-containing protein [Phycisphaerae bacterium]NIU08155.1 PEP-CTERM sorting domain-containing protein [Phycisphaerae bacterium]NIU55698.1 PEP-CTERM sorting domain-containing protein [Phycisphaerae bacterium]
MKTIKLVIFLCVLICGVFYGTSKGVTIKASVSQMPGSGGELFGFDLFVSDGPNPAAQGFQATVGSVSGPGVLTFDAAASKTVTGESSYWLHGNSTGANAIDNGDGSYTFGDGPASGTAVPLVIDDIVARYAFIWDGTEGDYTFTLDLGTDMSYILLEDFISKEALQLPAGIWYDYPIISADSTSFTVHIPEPTTLAFLGLGCLTLLKRRKR